jgi:5'-nucleotidase
MHILICNDDGIDAPGLAALEAAAYSVTDKVSVIAPLHEHSAQSHAITVRHPILVNRLKHPTNLARYAVEGTPTDCVRLGILELCPLPVDLVLSGVNPGANMGWEIFFSGTVAIAAEAHSFGIPGVAFSLATWSDHDFQAARPIVETIVRQIARHDLTKPFLYNVNLPPRPAAEVKGVRITTLEPNVKGDKYECRQAPDGRDYYWATWGERAARRAELHDPAIDVVAVREGYVSLTKLRYEVSTDPATAGLAEQFSGLRFA